MGELSMWESFWVWVDKHYIYQTAVLSFIVGYIFFNVFKINLFHLGKDGLTIQKDGKKVNIGDEIIDKLDGMDKRIGSVEKQVDVVESTLNTHYGFIRNAVVQSGIGVAWSDKGAPFDETVKAILMNISLGENGNHEDRLVEVIMGRGKDKGVQDYRSKLNEFIKENRERLTPYFYDAIERVNKRLH